MKPKRVRTLTLEAPSSPGRLAWISAASGLVKVGKSLYVVADDELSLGIFEAEGEKPGKLLKLFDGELPLDPKARKKEKPDLEGLALLPGGLLAVPSGSKPNRCRGSFIPLASDGKPSGSPQDVNFSKLYEKLSKEIKALNIEGAAVLGEKLILLQRGNSASGENLLIELDLEKILKAIGSKQPLPDAIRSITSCDLGKLRNVPLSFTDACPLPNGRLLFTAAAEQTDDPYLDGPCEGSALGIIEKNRIAWIEEIKGTEKVEGVWAVERENEWEVLMVTDGDEAGKPATLFGTKIQSS
ncbi:MAG: hypothetical protein AB1405_07410 [Bdellovibrionota bacterium]